MRALVSRGIAPMRYATKIGTTTQQCDTGNNTVAADDSVPED